MAKAVRPMQHWMRNHTTSEKSALATAVGTSPKMLYHYAEGFRAPSIERAIAIEKATKGAVHRADWDTACHTCEFARKCMTEAQRMRSELDAIV